MPIHATRAVRPRAHAHTDAAVCAIGAEPARGPAGVEATIVAHAITFRQTLVRALAGHAGDGEQQQEPGWHRQMTFVCGPVLWGEHPHAPDDRDTSHSHTAPSSLLPGIDPGDFQDHVCSHHASWGALPFS